MGDTALGGSPRICSVLQGSQKETVLAGCGVQGTVLAQGARPGSPPSPSWCSEAGAVQPDFLPQWILCLTLGWLVPRVGVIGAQGGEVGDGGWGGPAGSLHSPQEGH